VFGRLTGLEKEGSNGWEKGRVNKNVRLGWEGGYLSGMHIGFSGWDSGGTTDNCEDKEN